MDRALLSGPVQQVAPRLLGTELQSRIAGELVGLRITEVEAYGGADDPASHAFRGRTPRNNVMFGEPGHLYLYFIYGRHWCANVVAHDGKVPGAVLLRAGEVTVGEAVAQRRHPSARSVADLARGPARLARVLGLTQEQNGANLLHGGADLSQEGHQPAVQLCDVFMGPTVPVSVGPRVGISTAAERPWRFWITGDQTVSAYRRGGRRKVLPEAAD